MCPYEGKILAVDIECRNQLNTFENIWILTQITNMYDHIGDKVLDIGEPYSMIPLDLK